MQLAQIKACVDAGLTVCWDQAAYTVHQDSGSSNGYSIVYDQGGRKENRIGLTWQDGVRMNGDPDDFYVDPKCLSYALDDTCGERDTDDTTGSDCRYVGFDGIWVAVFPYISGCILDDGEACELAIDLLLEKKWFADETQTEPHIVI